MVEGILEIVEIVTPGERGPTGITDIDYRTRAALVTAVFDGLMMADGSIVFADGLAYKWDDGATTLSDLPDLVPSGIWTLRHFGAVGNGVTNDAVKILAALNSNHGIDGESLSYAVSGSMAPTPSALLNFRNANLVQIAPLSNTRTLSVLNVPLWFFQNINIDMGGFFTAGNTQDANGIRINGGSGSAFDCMVFNGGPSSAFAVLFADNVFLQNISVHSMEWNLSSIADDILQEIWITNCDNATLIGCRAQAVTGTNNGVAEKKYSRGFAIAGTRLLKISGCSATGVDQGFDTSGGDPGNTLFSYVDSSVDECATWGFKFANTSNSGLVTGCIGSNCGAGTFVVSAGQNLVGAVENSSHVHFSNCIVRNPGGNSGNIWGAPKGFQVIGRDPDTGDVDTSVSVPTHVTFGNCHCIDTQSPPTMRFGFYSDVDLTSGLAPNISCDALCTVTGAQDTDFFQVNHPRDSYDANGKHTFAASIRTNASLGIANLLSLDRQTLTLVNGDNNNISGYNSYNRISGPSAAYSITGFAAPIDQGAVVILHSSITHQLTLKHSSASSTSGNRIRTMTGTDLVLPSGSRHTLFLYYDAAESIWMVAGVSTDFAAMVYASIAASFVAAAHTYSMQQTFRIDGAGAITAPMALYNRSSTAATEVRFPMWAGANDYGDNRYAYIAAIINGASGNDVVIATNNAGNSGTEKIRIKADGAVKITGNFGRGAPSIKTANFSWGTTENWTINNKSGSSCTVTLPNATGFVGRELEISNYQAQTVISDLSNVVPFGGGAAGTAILAATVGKWATLVSDGTNWLITRAG